METTKWISKKIKPKTEDVVLTVHKRLKVYELGFYDTLNKKWKDEHGNRSISTHWMPLPKPPKL